MLCRKRGLMPCPQRVPSLLNGEARQAFGRPHVLSFERQLRIECVELLRFLESETGEDGPADIVEAVPGRKLLAHRQG